MSGIVKLDKLDAEAVSPAPFPHLVVRDVVAADRVEDVLADFPKMDRRGAHLLADVRYGGSFGELIGELEGPAFRHIVAKKFDVELDRYQTLLTVRGRLGPKDGQIHTDLADKVITVLLYLNREWREKGGRLRLLRSANLDDCFVEIPPLMGTMLIFERCDWSWHGHEPFEGERKAIQLNWVKSDRFMRVERLTQKVSRAVDIVRRFRR